MKRLESIFDNFIIRETRKKKKKKERKIDNRNLESKAIKRKIVSPSRERMKICRRAVYNPRQGGKKEKYADEQTFIWINIVTRGCLLCRA